MIALTSRLQLDSSNTIIKYSCLHNILDKTTLFFSTEAEFKA